MSGFPGFGFTATVRHLIPAWSPFSSLPPEVDMPVPLLVGAMPVVSRVEFAEGAGSRLLRVVCAYASEPERTNVAANAMVASFIESAKLQK